MRLLATVGLGSHWTPSRGAWRPPGSMAFKHRIQNEEQTAHCRHQGHLRQFTASAQTLIKGLQHWIAADRSDGGDVEHAAQTAAPTLDHTHTLHAAAVLIEGRHPGQSSDLA